MVASDKNSVYLIWIILLTGDRYLSWTECAYPEYIWPLDGQYGNAEVIHGATQTNNACNIANTGTSTGHPQLGYDAVQFYGTVNSYMDLFLHLNTTLEDFTITIFLNTTLPIVGTIFHYKTPVTSSVDMYANEILMYGNGTHIVVQILGLSSVDHGTISVDDPELLTIKQQMTDTWIPVTVIHDHSSGEIQIRIDTSTLVKADNSFTGNVYFGQPGILRLGDRQGAPGDPFAGMITCVQLYSSKFTDFQQALALCDPADWPITPTTVATPAACTGNTGYFVLSGRDKIPDPVYVINLLTSSVTSSPQCGDLCLRTNGCVSFATNKGSNSCHLYSNDYAACLQESIGTNYYVTKSC